MSGPAANIGGVFVTAEVFATDAITLGNRVTVNAGVRFDHSRAISQDLHALSADGVETDEISSGAGTLYTWNVWSPRAGVIAKLTPNGRTMLRSSYGRFTQGVLTGEIQGFHPGARPLTFTGYVAETGTYTGPARVVDPKALVLDAGMRSPTPTSSRSASIVRWVARCQLRSHTSQGRPQFHRLDRYRRPVPGGHPVIGQRPDDPALRAHERRAEPAVPVDQSVGILPDIQRARDGVGEAPVPGMAGVRFVYAVQSSWPAALWGH